MIKRREIIAALGSAAAAFGRAMLPR